MNLTIAIPTYNRHVKLRRTVANFARQLDNSPLASSIEILVSDNASPDDTPTAMRELIAQFPNVAIRYRRHPENLGISGNLLSLYRGAAGDYVWFFSDDDVPFPDCLQRLLPALQQHAPSILFFSFTQPPGSKYRAFNFSEDVHLVTQPVEIVQFVRQVAKLTTHVYRRTALPPEPLERTAGLMQTCQLFGFWSLTLDVIAANASAPLAIISEPLAGCDDDFTQCLNWPPLNWKLEARVFEHRYVQTHAPAIYRDREKWMYQAAFAFFWQWRSGEVGIGERFVPLWWAALKKFPIRWKWVLPHKGMIVKAFILKLAPRGLPRIFQRAKNRFAKPPA